MILFIVGNGLDKSLGLPTDYQDNLRPILEQIDNKKEEFINDVFFLGNEKLWSDFENNIGNVKDLHPIWEILEKYEDELITYKDIYSFVNLYDFNDERSGSDFEAVDNAIDAAESNKPTPPEIEWQEFVDNGMTKMIEVANSTVINNTSFPIINNFKDSGKFITFNYTNTLERAFGISTKDILHIHGTLKNGLIYGNESSGISNFDKNDVDIIDFDGIQSDLPDTDYPSNAEDLKSIFTFDKEEQLGIITDNLNSENIYSKKELQLQSLIKWLQNIRDVDRIVVLGHSLGKVDTPYFELINKKYPNATWDISYYSDEEKTKMQSKINKLPFKNRTNLYQFDKLINTTSIQPY